MQAVKKYRNSGDTVKSKDDKAKWLIFPDYWKKSWGEPPCLGQVYADDEFEAIRKSYDKGLVRVNFTFGPKPIRADEGRPRYSNHKFRKH